jgi:DNA-binding CsgD family transcriptional regulator
MSRSGGKLVNIRTDILQDTAVAVLAADDPAARFAALTGGLAALGINQVNYGFFDPAAASHAEADIVFLSTMRSDWLAYYADRALHVTDPHVVKVRQGNLLPYRWGETALSALDDPVQCNTALETREAGIRSALCVPLAAPFAPARPVAGITLGSTLPESELNKATAPLGGSLVALAHLFHHLSFGALTRTRLGVKDLSPRERDALTLLAKGLRQAAIADKLKVSRVTVEMHLANARRKLKAATLPEAVARALCWQMIAP